MPRFSYIVRNKEGKKVVGSAEAAAAETLVADLQAKGLLVVSVFPEAGSVIVRKKKFSHKGIGTSDLVFFSRQLAVMLGASVPLLRTLDTILNQIENRSLYEVVSKIRNDVESGLSLKEALSKHPNVFNDFWLGLVETGEASGNLPFVLDRLATYLEKKATLKNRFISVIIYPVILFAVAIIAINVFIFIVVPKFEEIYSGANAKLPMLTEIVIGLSKVIGKNIIWIVSGFTLAIVLIGYYIRTPVGRKKLDIFVNRLPFFGSYFRNVAVERFILEMFILIESGVPIIYALEIVERGFAYTIIGDSLKRVKDGVRQGKSMGKYLEMEPIFPTPLVQMVIVGEETGEMPRMLKKLAEFYEEYIDNFIARLTAAFEPAMIIFMGLVIGTLVIAMFLPIFSLSQLGQGMK